MSGNTPTLRLEQDTSGSLSARTWDLGGNQTEIVRQGRHEQLERALPD